MRMLHLMNQKRLDTSSDFGDTFEDEQSFTGEETKSRFTSYSMTSSVIKRNEGLTLLDDRFEKVGPNIYLCICSLI